MLTVTFEKEGKKLTLKVEGHAGQAEIGHDIVCAATSILTYTVAQIVKYEADKGGFKDSPIISLKEGDSIVSCEPSDEKYAEILHSYYVARVGYMLLAHNFPQYVELKTFGTESESVNINQKDSLTHEQKE